MGLLLFIFILLCLYKLKIQSFNTEYISKPMTTRINGIFVFLVFLSHFSYYIPLNTSLDAPFKTFHGLLGQLIVVSFLFYSGYGIMESIKKKGTPYVNTILSNRFLRLLIMFDIAILLFLLTDYFLGYTFDLKTILLSFIGYESVMNSNWYIFVILILYLLTFISFKVTKNHYYLSAIIQTILCIIFIKIMIDIGKPHHWVNTCLVYSWGIWYSLFNKKIIAFINSHKLSYYIIFLISAICFILTWKLRSNLWMHSLGSIFFMSMIILLSMKFNSSNPMLLWLGQHVFSIYILQRIPMMIGHHWGLDHYPYIYFFISFVATIIIALIYERISNTAINKILRKKKANNNSH
ncbi:acyltransferase family protein [Breznakia sp. OttesenSCG-928-G09]|nr:acyltransferase family protein [Breznakia sp. OttesenSCG-928-G09]